MAGALAEGVVAKCLRFRNARDERGRVGLAVGLPVAVAEGTEALGEVGQELLLAADHAVHLEDAGLGLGMDDSGAESRVARDKEQGGLQDDVGDEEGREEVAVGLAMGVEGMGNLVLALPEGVEAKFLEIGRAHV